MRHQIAISTLTLSASLLSAQTVELDPIVANANRILTNGTENLASVSSFELQEVESAHFRDVSDVLHAYPGFASYRRTHPTSAHPATQGVRLRNFGSNASARSLVLLDGVPQNDPFGGWVYWHRYDSAQLEAITLYPSGIGETWGNMASGGIISLVALPPSPGARFLQASYGSSDRIDLRLNSAHALSDSAVFDFGLRHFQSDGFYTLHPSQRGPIDERANSEATAFNTRLSWRNGDLWNSQLSLRALDEKRGNGTPVSRNSTEAIDLNYLAQRDLEAHDAHLNFSLFYQDRDFQNVFASVAQDRSSERPALDQYDMPAESIGGSIVYRQDGKQAVRFSGGADFRHIKGSVNERYRNLGAGFTRDRHAGGEQEFYGLFAVAEWELSPEDTLAATARLENVKRVDGRRIETNTETDTVIRDDRYPDEDSDILSGNLNWRHEFTDTTNSNFILFSGYRAPTLNELYRPFRVRNDITEANPLLAKERHQGIELSLATQKISSTDLSSSFRISAFYYEAEEMIANALITTESGFDPRFGFIPEGGSGSSRVNLDESTVSGIEIHATHELTQSLFASLTAIYSETEIDSDELAELEGNSFPHSAPWKAVAGLNYSANEQLQFAANYRWYDRSWENLANTRRLGATSDLTLAAHYQLDDTSRISLTLTNALDEENRSGLASNGLITIDEPRELLLTYTWRQ
ncbi:TonB-dependent receptor [Pelagicoccus mobilis]|uniref:TonB-dependent receptor plug domain-containing protein n=1 Tax=Pelagicoccus mobilis TaxID=415221 RepID=A0A934RU00_9BACT|nr:TonB-dependent receptor plug domain-containing protein [Pelagicoccus mobilis]MBK1877585.1 TonB-dependent receptor plug domain-containing protein [Pelagicoccus mobilis]